MKNVILIVTSDVIRAKLTESNGSRYNKDVVSGYVDVNHILATHLIFNHKSFHIVDHDRIPWRCAIDIGKNLVYGPPGKNINKVKFIDNKMIHLKNQMVYSTTTLVSIMEWMLKELTANDVDWFIVHVSTKSDAKYIKGVLERNKDFNVAKTYGIFTNNDMEDWDPSFFDETLELRVSADDSKGMDVTTRVIDFIGSAVKRINFYNTPKKDDDSCLGIKDIEDKDDWISVKFQQKYLD